MSKPRIHYVDPVTVTDNATSGELGPAVGFGGGEALSTGHWEKVKVTFVAWAIA